MKRVVITGLGFVTSIGNSRAEVSRSLRENRTGVELFSEFANDPAIPVKLAGTVKDFTFPSTEFEDWTFPARYKIPRDVLRPMTPNALYAYCAMRQAIEDANLLPEQVSDPLTGLMCASGGSMWMAYANLDTIVKRGVMKTQPMSIINSIPGSLYINLVPAFKIRGASLGLSSACSSSSHALGLAVDLIRTGKQKTVFVVGAEDCNKFSILPFATVRALSVQTDPAKSPCAFDRKRDGFVGTGGRGGARRGGTRTRAGARRPGEHLCGGARLGPGVRRIQRARTRARRRRALPGDDDGARRRQDAAGADRVHQRARHLHAVRGRVGDQCIKSVFPEGQRPLVSSTKSLTGHGLSLAGAMEAAFCCVNLREGFVPVSAHITELDPMCAGVPVITEPVDLAPKIVMNNSSGFGGTNVATVLRKWEPSR